MAVRARQRDQVAMMRACRQDFRRRATGWHIAALALLCTACASHPPGPDWEQVAQAEVKRFTTDYLSGHTTQAEADFARARRAVRDTGRGDLVAQLELVRCAVRVAVLEFDDCRGYVALSDAATPVQQSYAAYLTGQWQAVDLTQLPEQHRAVVAASSRPNDPTTKAQPTPSALPTLVDPLATLVAAGASLQSGHLQAGDVELAIDVASAQGWRRPLLAWLGVASHLAQQRGDQAAVERISRRVALVTDE